MSTQQTFIPKDAVRALNNGDLFAAIGITSDSMLMSRSEAADRIGKYAREHKIKLYKRDSTDWLLVALPFLIVTVVLIFGVADLGLY